MSTTQDANTTRRPTLGQRWRGFWFPKIDPTTFGFIRIVTGCLVLYTHLAYSLDLTAFFGPDAWTNVEVINRERKDAPYVLPPLGWDQPLGRAALPEMPHRRRALMEYLRTISENNPTLSELNPKLKMLDRVQTVRNPLQVAALFAYIAKLSPLPDQRANQLAALVDESKSLNETPPPFIQGVSRREREELAQEIEAFYPTLPAETDREPRTYVLNHLGAINYAQRAGLIEFLRYLTTVSPEQREYELDYLDHWGIERHYVDDVGSPIFSFWFHVTDPTERVIAHCIVLLLIVLFTVGLFTRVTSVLVWLAALCYIHRTQHVLFGMDTMMNILLFYLMIGNSGAALSLDRLRNRYRAARLSLQRNGTIDAATQAYLLLPPRSTSVGLATRMLQIHFCFIYLSAGLAKLKGDAWWNTTAYWDTVANPEFTLIYYQWYESALRWLTANRVLYSINASIGVGITFLSEIGLPFLIWTRLRPWIIIFALMFHSGVAIFMGLWIFSLLMMTMLLIYVPGAAVRYRLFGKPRESTTRVPLIYDPGSETHHNAVAIYRALDFDDQLELKTQPKGSTQGITTTVEGKTVTGASAVGPILRSLWWVGLLRPMVRLFLGKRLAG